MSALPEIQISLWTIILLMILIFDTLYIMTSRFFSGSYGWNGIFLGLSTFIKSFIKVIIYYFEAVFIGIAIKWATGPNSNSSNSSVMNLGIQMLKISFLPLVCFVWLKEIIEELIKLYEANIDKNKSLKNLSLFEQIQDVDNSIAIFWLPVILTLIPLTLFSVYVSKNNIFKNIVDLSVPIIIFGLCIWQLVDDFKKEHQNFKFWMFFREKIIDKLKKHIDKVFITFGFLGSAISFYLLINFISIFKAYFFKHTISLNIFLANLVVIVDFILISFLFFFRKKIKNQIKIWTYILLILNIILSLINMIIILINKLTIFSVLEKSALLIILVVFIAVDVLLIIHNHQYKN